LSDARTRGGEFVNEDIIKIMDEDSLTDAALNEILKLGADRKSWLLFCTGVRHAEKVCKKLEDRGIKSACITGETDSNLRAWTLSEFKKGNIQAITNCDVLTTGFDAPNIDLLILLRPTKSAGLYIQMVGRGSRLAPNKKDCLILDFAGNIDRFGPLDAIKIKHKNGKAIVGKEPTKTCPSCEELVPIGMTRCAVCGFEFQSERMIKHDVKASSAPLFSEEREFQVQGFDANIHSKPGKPDSVRLNFYCIGLTVSHFLCFQHQGFAKKVAIRWWKENCVQHGAPAILENLDHAIDSIKKLPRPKKIICIKDGKFWRLNKVEWDENRSNYLEAANEILDEIGINI
jgi:DNA repair protein RadD